METLTVDAAGWVAATLTACCFACTRMLRLRALALMANLSFIVYGSLAGLAPVLVLHLILAPLNTWHLVQQWRVAQRRAPALQRAEPSKPQPQPQLLPPSFIEPLDAPPVARRRPRGITRITRSPDRRHTARHLRTR